MTKPTRAKRIADLNDKFRKTFVTGGRVYMLALGLSCWDFLILMHCNNGCAARQHSV
jgi:hypothetical protein